MLGKYSRLWMHFWTRNLRCVDFVKFCLFARWPSFCAAFLSSYVHFHVARAACGRWVGASGHWRVIVSGAFCLPEGRGINSMCYPRGGVRGLQPLGCIISPLLKASMHVMLERVCVFRERMCVCVFVSVFCIFRQCAFFRVGSS